MSVSKRNSGGLDSPSVIGFGGSTHDFSIYAIDSNGNHLALEDERHSRSKFAFDGFSEKTHELLVSFFDGKRADLAVLNDAITQVPSWMYNTCHNTSWITHHLSHAAWSFYTSGFDKAVIVVVDGCGSIIQQGSNWHTREVTTIWSGQGSNINLLELYEGRRNESAPKNSFNLLTSNSIGDFYEAITRVIGFGDLQAGKTMAMAGIGKPRFVEQLMELVGINPNGSITLDLSSYSEFHDALESQLKTKIETDSIRADLASSAQVIFEYAMSAVLKRAYTLFPSERLCLSGGCALNVTYNGKINEITPFKHLHIVNAPGDSGTAGGAALWGRKLLNKPITHNFGTISLGPVHSNYESLESQHLLSSFRIIMAGKKSLDKVVELMRANEILIWHQGRSEYGPRALGNRCIICRPNLPCAKDYINTKIKHRLTFQPFGLAICEKLVSKIFINGKPSPYMEKAFRVHEEYIELVRETIHSDGTVRVQTVKYNDPFFELLEKMKLSKLFPAILNTSLNSKGEPICETVSDTLEFWRKVPIRYAFIEGRLYEKCI